MVILHDFLDHLDGIVAKAQKQTYGSVDDPLLGGFMDAFCDKVSAALYLRLIYLFEQAIDLKLFYACTTIICVNLQKTKTLMLCVSHISKHCINDIATHFVDGTSLIYYN